MQVTVFYNVHTTDIATYVYTHYVHIIISSTIQACF